MKKTILIVILLLAIFAFVWVILPQSEEDLPIKVTENWVGQPLDHDDPEAGQFRQQILTLVPDGITSDADLFFIIGNETDATEQGLINYWKSYGRPQNMVFAIAEHRGYGQSIWDEDNTVPVYVTNYQALADDNLVLTELKQKWKGRVLSVGCSYGGALAIQFAHDYPDAMDATIASSPPIHWPFVIPEYAEQVRENLGEGLTDRFAEHIANLQSEVIHDENWRKKQLLTALASGLSQRQDSQSLVPVVNALSFLPTEMFVSNIERIIPAEGFHWSDNRLPQTVTADMAKTGAYNWYTWKYQQCTVQGSFFTGDPFAFSAEDAKADCKATFGDIELMGEQSRWDVNSLIPNISKPVTIIVGGKDPWTKLSVQPDHQFSNIEYLNISDDFHCPDKDRPEVANRALIISLGNIGG